MLNVGTVSLMNCKACCNLLAFDVNLKLTSPKIYPLKLWLSNIPAISFELNLRKLSSTRVLHRTEFLRRVSIILNGNLTKLSEFNWLSGEKSNRL